ncbi:hypothetical protein HXX02_03595 [Microbulbifer elongatus]|uniref:Guanylate cyclase domain-containing protein n=1 Tax=Microbulbifer elongatus TaxID=86173 RepID=A0ABT1NX97_9GAMM|nr:hypothetical protein [Microbulbifer elongatus]MCQ3828518.1 hypothetical protein [Microbulbifer elongatus]
MYSNKVIAFVDILGFKSLISRSEKEEAIAESLLNVLTSLLPEQIQEESSFQINYDRIPKEQVEEVEKLAKLFSKGVFGQCDIKISYFSDCIVLSAPAEDEMSCFMIFEYLAKLMVRVFEEYNLLLRGGISMGKLYHEQAGPLFGPAMVDAYEIESKLAIYPRILLEKNTFRGVKSTERNTYMLPLFSEKNGEGYITLASAYQYLATSSTMATIPNFLDQLINGYTSSLSKSIELAEKFKGSKHEDKYEWALNEMRSIEDEMKSLG